MMTQIKNFMDISTLSTSADPAGFASALSVWINKPHVVNRRLCGTKIVSFDVIPKVEFNIEQMQRKLEDLGYDMGSKLRFVGKIENIDSSAKCTKQDNGPEERLQKSIELEINDMKTKSVMTIKCKCSNHGCLKDELTKDNAKSVKDNLRLKTLSNDVGMDAIRKNVDVMKDVKMNGEEANINLSKDTESENKQIKDFNYGNSHTDSVMNFSSHNEDVMNNLEYKASGINDLKYQQNMISKFEPDHGSDLERQTGTDGYSKGDLKYSSISSQTGSHRGSEKHNSEVVTEVDGLAGYEDDIVVIVRELVPKQPDRHENIPELIIYDKTMETCTFYPISRESQVQPYEDSAKKIELTYQFAYNSRTWNQETKASITLSVSCSSYSEDSRRKLSLTWLQGQLLPKIAKWSEEPNLKTSLTSLKLVPLEEYNALYNELKIKYGQHFAKIWPEKTDPQKYVYEDVAIATYLLLLWKCDREKKNLTKKQAFIDLGCGNGLLVHILASEGHPGYGLDVRKRNIWDLYGRETVLKEMPITPSRESLFPDADWLIGNHSDELTPWIPVMAARSSYSCCYFVLPCCHYDFDSRFSQSVVGGSQYREYLNYIQTVGENCGFTVEEDMLRIPSTKRVCFIGRSRTYIESEEPLIDERRTLFINSRCSQSKSDSDKTLGAAKTFRNKVQGETWSAEFAPRSKIEMTRNCVTVRKETKETVIRSVFERLLSSDMGEVKRLQDGRTWRKGGSLTISEVVKMFNSSLLQELKSECGGIQTLLRNSSQIFQVTSGKVQLRDFTLDDPWGRKRNGNKTNTSDFFKTSLCWFNLNHPDGCPRPSELCNYAHSDEELQEKPSKVKKIL